MNTPAVILVLTLLPFTLGDPLIQLPKGKILGRTTTTIENTTYFAFEGIPYAAPPVGTLRFKAPQDPSNWNDILNTTYLNTYCYQIGSNTESETEDCLHLNVYTPQLPDENNNVSLPVMFFIYGGGFIAGFTQMYNPDLFIDNNVIIVTVNYRVGIFGFLSTEDEIIPGNNGLKDQQLAIKWTHNNINLFGGDPNKITIFGESAGSASCAYQLLNQNNNGLFQGAILQSGTSLSPWTLQRNSRKIAFATAALVNPDFASTNDSVALLDFLQSMESSDLDTFAQNYHDANVGPENYEIFQGYTWAPVIEVKNPEAFLTKKMYGLLEAGNFVTVPTIIGINSEEMLFLFPDANVLKTLMANYDTNLDWLVPNDMQISDSSNRTDMGRLIRELYTNGELLADNLGSAIRYSSDNALTRSVIKYAELSSKTSKTYFYQLSYDGELGHGNTVYPGAEKVGHGEDLYYLFCKYSDCDDSSYSESDRTTRKRLLKLWTDFAKSQNPTPEPSDLLQNVTWLLLETREGNFYYLDINENLEVKNHPKEESYNEWIALYNSLGYSDFDTF